MVRIRYSELPVGLHVTAVAAGRKTIVYLLPGLTAAERRSALLRVRSSARMGHGPSLPAFALMRAVAADRLRVGLRTFGAVMRRHPLLLVPFAAVVSSVTVLVLVSGTPAATPGLLATATARPAASTPSIWRAFARYPVPLVQSDALIRFRHHRRDHDARSLRSAEKSHGGHQVRQESRTLTGVGTLPGTGPVTTAPGSTIGAVIGSVPSPRHIGTGSPDQAAQFLAPGRSAAATL